jgi:putative peptidoglycan lipid II flippase
VFYAIRQSRVPVAVSLCTIAINIAANVALVRVMGFRGLALGTSLAMLVNGAALMLLLRRRLRGLEGAYLAMTFGKIASAALVMAAVASGVERFASGVAPGAGSLTQTVRLGSAIGGGLLALAGAAKLLRIREFDEAVAALRARMTTGKPG